MHNNKLPQTKGIKLKTPQTKPTQNFKCLRDRVAAIEDVDDP
jgi:hypothetical protein